MRFLHKIAKDAEGLSYLELVKLDEAIHRLLETRIAAESEIRERPDREAVEHKQVGRITLLAKAGPLPQGNLQIKCKASDHY